MAATSVKENGDDDRLLNGCSIVFCVRADGGGGEMKER